LEELEEELLRRVFTQAYPYSSNTKYRARFVLVQKEEARQASRGIWGHSHAEQYELAYRGNGIGGGGADCRLGTLQTDGSQNDSRAGSSEDLAARTSPPRKKRKRFSTRIAQTPTISTENPKTTSPARTCPRDDRR